MENSKIAWTDHTFNPWWGCHKISPACKLCYADTFARRLGKSLWGPTADRPVASDAYWNQPIKWNAAAAKTGQRARVFCASMADVFEVRAELVEPRQRLARLIEATPHLDWLLLTKRTKVMANMARWEMGWTGAWPDNVWAGTTVENQETAHERIPHLLQVPARVRFLSVEPLLEAVDLDPAVCDRCGIILKDIDTSDDGTLVCTECGREAAFGAWLDPCADARQGGINWVIIGSESGPKARPMKPEWARAIVDDCLSASVAVFVKQIATEHDKKGTDGSRWPPGNWPQQFPGEAAR